VEFPIEPDFEVETIAKETSEEIESADAIFVEIACESGSGEALSVESELASSDSFGVSSVIKASVESKTCEGLFSKADSSVGV